MLFDKFSELALFLSELTLILLDLLLVLRALNLAFERSYGSSFFYSSSMFSTSYPHSGQHGNVSHAGAP